MTEWLLRQLNITDEFTGHLDEVSVGFQNLPADPGLRATVVGFAILVLVGLAYFIYRRQLLNLPTVPGWIRFTLTATRVIILAMLLLVLAGPILRLDHKSEKKPVVGLLFDHSQSMQLPAGPFDSENELTRTAEAAGYKTVSGAVDSESRKALNRIPRAKLAHSVVQSGAGKTWVENLGKKYELRYYGFAKDTTQLGVDPTKPELPEPPSPGGAATYIGDAITKVMDEAAGRHVAGLVVFSDGQSTGGRSAADAALTAAAASTPVFGVPVGSSTRLQDVAIVDLFTTGLVSVGDTARVAVTLESQGFDRRPIKVELKDGDKVIDSKDLILNTKEQQQVELTFKADKPGARYLTVNVPAQAEEADHLRSNNIDTAFLRVTEEKMKVLYVEGQPRWDFRFIKNAIRRDHGLGGRTSKEPDIVIETEWRRLKTPPEKQAALPRTLEQLAEYHTVILGDASPDLLDKAFVDLLAKAVRERGVGLVVAAGTQAMPHKYGDALHELLPVMVKRGQAGMYPRGIPSFRVELAPEGSIHEAMRFYDEPGRNGNAWSNLPRFFWAAATERPAPGATVLAWNPIPGAYGKLPLIAQHYAGKGRVLFVGTDETWRWRQNVGDRFFYKFWGQALRHVARRDAATEKKSWIEVRPVRAQPGEQAQIELMAFAEDGAPRTDANLNVQIQAPGTAATVQMSADSTLKGHYVGKYTPEKPGEYKFTYAPGGKAEPVEARLRVAVAPEELRQPNVNRVALEQMAAASGGKLVELPDLAGITEYLQGDSKFTELHREASLWDNGLFLGILIFVYCLDVGLRRLLGLS